MWLPARLDFAENVWGGGEIFKEGATMISPCLQRVEIKITYFYTVYIIISACLVVRNSIMTEQ